MRFKMTCKKCFKVCGCVIDSNCKMCEDCEHTKKECDILLSAIHKETVGSLCEECISDTFTGIGLC